MATLLLLGAAGCRGRSMDGANESIAVSTAALSGDAGSDAGPASPSLGSFALYATESVELDQNATVTGCNIGVEYATGPFLSGGVAASFNSGSSLQATRTLYADSVVLNAGSAVGAVDSNHLTANSGSTHGAVSTFPVMPAAPTMPAATAGTTAITVNSGTRTLSPGAYGAVTANRGATIALTGGSYVFASLTLNGSTSLTVSAPTTLSVTGAASFNSGTFVGPAAGSGLTAKALILFFDSSQGLSLNSTMQAHALVVATKAQVAVNTSQFYGAIAAAQIVMNSGSAVTCEDGFGCQGSCDDGNPCTADACSLGACTHTAVANGTACSDGNACTQTDSCQAGTCTGANPVSCSGADQCHVAGTCDPSTGVCSNPAAPNGSACNDGNACTQSDSCQSGACTGSNPVTCAAPDQCHAPGTCNAATGQCSNPTVADGTTCNDGNKCDSNDTCKSGVCTAGSTVTCAASDQCHVAGTCSPATGLCSNPPVTDGTACSDGNACTQTDVCLSGTCSGSNPVTCTASDQCHVAGTCNASTGQCSNPAAANGTTCSDGNACTQSDICQSGACAGANPVTCTASDQCHVAGTCSPSTGQCSNPAAANGAACSDGNACTQTDTCQAGTCAGANPVTCTASDQCHVAGTCNTSTGQCSNPAAANGTTCSDGNACTQTDTCQAGACAGANPVTCTASDQCHVAGTCSSSTGQCSNPAAANGTSCTDGNACTQTDTCQAGACAGANPVTCTASDQCHVAGTCNTSTGQCSNPAAVNGAACSDGNACTQSDTCQAGACAGANPVTCTASDQCHVAGTCDTSTGQCSNPAVADGTSCSDGNACTQTDTCQTGTCTGASPVTCAASDQCHAAGTCDTSTGHCSNPAVTDGTSCNDGNPCDVNDTCAAGACVAGGTLACAASDQCHAAGTCDPTTGACTNPAVADGTACNDGNLCDANDTCKAGACTAGTTVSCAASDQCHTAGACNPATGSCSNPAAADGTACNDGNACTQADACKSGACGSGNPVTCTALDACHTAGTCDPASGSCSNPLKPACPPGLPPDPATVAPPLDRTVVTTVYDQTKYVYNAPSPDLLIQTGVAAGTISPSRVCELYGQVLLPDGEPEPGATITIVDHPELGTTMSRADGNFTFVVNGGEALTIDYQATGFLGIQRTVTCPYQTYVPVPPVVVTPADPNITTITSSSSSWQVAKGSVVTDPSGTRQGILLFPPGTQGSALTSCGGTPTPLNTMTMRITEYTVGANGPAQMPATLPPASAYTYAFETSVDEAMAMGAVSVQLNQPVIYYVDDFLHFPAGTVVPLGSYLRSGAACTTSNCSTWVTQPSGVVLTVLAVSNGLATLDVTGSGTASSPAQLTSLGVTTAEQQQIAQLYPAGKSVWRMQLPHFSIWDGNWGFGPPNDAIAANGGPPMMDVIARCRTEVGNGTSVDPASQTAAQKQPVVGTPYNLVYQSDHVSGRGATRDLLIPLSGPTIPKDVTGITLQVVAAGNTFQQTFPPSANLSYTYQWNGADSLGRQLQGAQPISVRVGFQYAGVYEQTSRFGETGNGTVIVASKTRLEVELPTYWQVVPPAFDEAPNGLGGWNIDVHHTYDPTGTLYLGDGTTRAASGFPSIITTVSKGSTPAADGVPVAQALFANLTASAVAADGTVYVIDADGSGLGNPNIYRIPPSGILQRVAGMGVANSAGYSGDEGPANQARINPGNAGRLALARECDGGFYFVDAGNSRVRYVDGKGIIHTVVGTGVSRNEYTPLQDNVPASQFILGLPQGLAVAPDGSIYVSQLGAANCAANGGIGGNVIRVGTDGVASYVTGCGDDLASEIPAKQAYLFGPLDVAAGPDGTVYIADRSGQNGTARVRALSPSGIMKTVGGPPLDNYTPGENYQPVDVGVPPVDGGPVATTNLNALSAMTVGADGTVYVVVNSPVYGSGLEIFSIPGDGKVHLVAGSSRQTGDGVSQGVLLSPTSLALAPDRSIYAPESRRLRRVQPVALPGLGPQQFNVGSTDGREAYVFDAHGRHLRTVDSLTGAARFTFGYDNAGRLASIADGANNVTTIGRNSSGLPTSIVNPYGQVTVLGTDGSGFLASIANPAGQTAIMTYAPTQAGLLTRFEDPAGNALSLAYDAKGRLTQTNDAIGGKVNFTPRDDTGVGVHTVSRTTTLGVSSSSSVAATLDHETRIATLPSGLHASQTTGAGGVVATKLASGGTATLTQGADPRFGVASPILSSLTVASPAGLSFNQTTSRTVNLSDPTNILSLTSLTDTIAVDPTTGAHYSNVYTASTRQWLMTTPVGRTRNITLDAIGRLASSQRDSLNADIFTYDAKGRLSAVSQGTRTRGYAYDANGMLATVTDPAHNVTTFQRDAAGRVTSQALADGSVVVFGYDADGRLASMTPPTDAVHRFTHSATGQLASYVAPAVAGVASTTTAYVYDADGRLVSFTRPDGAAAIFGYDAAGRTGTVTIPSGQLTIAYDRATGRPSSATGAQGETITYGYDGTLSTQLAWSGPVSGQVVFTYDKAMKLVAEAVNGSAVSFGYDADGVMTKAGQMTLTANTAGLVTGTALGGVTDTITYDSFGERATYAAKYQGTSLVSETYTRDALGRIATKSETVQGQTHAYAYTYDVRGRLANVTTDGATTAHYTYDTNGNRLTAATGTTTLSASYDAQDRLLTYGTLSYTYGAGGELATKTDSATGSVTTYTYDALGNLTGVVLPNGDVLGYVIDAAGRRVAKSYNGKVRQEWLYRDSLRPVAELDGAGVVTSRFVYTDNAVADASVLQSINERLGLARETPLAPGDLGRPMYIKRGSQTLRVIADHLGSARLLVDVSTGAAVQGLSYDEFGNVSTATGNGVPTLTFVGGIYDPDTGLVHFGARDYDAQTGRWTSKEPMKTAGTLNFYQYAGGDPINDFDVDGLAKIACPDKQTILDSICGPNAEGEVRCVGHAAEPTGETGVTQAGSPTNTGSDTTAQGPSSTDLPTVPGDGSGTTSEGWVDLGGAGAAANQPPVVSVGSSSTLTVTMPANNVPLHGSVTDSGPYPPQVLWTWTSGPAAPVFSEAASAATTVSFPQPGVYQLVLLASDLEYQSSASLTVTVLGPPLVEVTGPPVVDGFDSQNAGTAPVFAARVTEPLPGHTATTQWTMMSGPGTVTFGTPTGSASYGTSGAPVILTTTALFSTAGTYVLSLTATDGTFSASASLSVTIGGDQPPVVSTSGDQTLPSPGHFTTVAGAASGYLPNLPLSYTWSQLSGPAAVTFTAPNQTTTDIFIPYPGAYVIQLTASDTQLTGTATLTITAQGNAPPQGPAGPAPAPPVIAGIVDDGVVSQPTVITGTFANSLWNLGYRLGGRDDVSTPFTTIASGTGAMTGGKLGTFDPTLLLNGMYTVQLTVSTTGGTATTTVAVAVDGRMKVGNFTLAFTDLEVPVGGLPIQLVRTYDSRDKRSGDFGFGWNLSVRDVRVEKSGKIGAYWQVLDQTPNYSFFSEYCLQPSQSSTVTVTFPNGREYRFAPQPQCAWLQPPDPQDITWSCTSDPGNPTITLTANGSKSLIVSGGQLLNLSDNQPWDPRQFTFTNELGIVYSIDQDKGATELRDRQGNTLSITPGGIFSSLGPSVPFVRDELGRITKITDPNGKPMAYAYDATGDLAAFTDRASNTTTFTYAGDHFLQEIMDPLGRHPIRCDYDGSGRLLDEIDNEGHQVTFATNLAANQQVVTDRLGRPTTYTYNRNGDITQKIDPTGATWSYTIDGYGNTLTSTDPLNHTTLSTYDGSRNLLTRTDPLGNTTKYTYNFWRQNLTTVDPLGHTTTNVYDVVNGNLLTTADALGNVTTYGYDKFTGFRTYMIDPLGSTTFYGYDAAGHLASMTDPLGRVTSYTYDTNGNKLSQTQTRTNSANVKETLVTSYTRDALNRVTLTTYPDGSTRSTTFTPTGKTAMSVDELGRTTSYGYDDLDRLLTTTRPDMTTESQTYDAENQRLTSTDAAGFTTAYQYDAAGRLTTTTHPDTASMTTTYDAAGRATATTDEASFTSHTGYDAAGRVTSQTDAIGNVTAYVYDAAGNQTSSIDPLTHVTMTSYDADNRRTGTTYADLSTDSVGYDAAGRMTSKTDQLGRVTAFGYDVLGRLTTVTDALGDVTTYAYDELGERVSQTDANKHVTTFAYDKRGRQTQRKLPDGSTETMTYDVAGEKTARLDFNGKTTTYGYDTLGRLTSRTYATDSTQNVSFSYTADGLRATAVDARGTTGYAYDNRRRLTSVVEPNGNQLGYAYDARGLRTSITATIGSQSLTTSTTYDADGRASAVQDPLGRSFPVTFDAASRRTQLGYPNTTATSYSYDVNNRLTSLATTQTPTGGGAPLTVASFGYVLDAEGKRTQLLEGDGTLRKYGYDSIDRLTTEAVTGSLAYAKTFAYDAVGNRLTQTTTGSGAGVVPYTYDTRDRMLTSDGSSYTYDANGNELTKSAEATYTSDLENRLAQVTLPNTTVTNAYDADGNRVRTAVAPHSGGSPVACSGNTATFAQSDTTTQGNWQGAYGADGEYINAEAPSPPAYGSVTFSNTNNYTWAASTTDVRALEQPPPQTSRISSTWYSSSETFHVATTDGHAHTVAFYFVDYLNEGRSQSVTAQTTTGTVLDSARPYSSFVGGVWAVYTVCGSVDFVVTRTAGSNATVSGVFFGTPTPGAVTTTNYLVDASGGLSQVVAETDGTGTLRALYVRDGEELLAVMRPGGSGGMWTTHFVHADGLGSVRAMTDETGVIVDTRGYEAFGTKNVEAGSDTLAYGFAGEPLDSTTKLAYHRARWMDSRVGRFAGMDPIRGYGSLPATLHRYSYVLNNPVNVVDPSGREGLEDVSIAGLGESILSVEAEAAPVHLAEVVEEVEASLVAGEAGGNAAVSEAGNVSVYISEAASGETQYVGITNNIARRALQHLASKGIQIRPILSGLTRLQARAVEQAVIDFYGLGEGSPLLNIINSISPLNPEYAELVELGYHLLDSIDFLGGAGLSL